MKAVRVAVDQCAGMTIRRARRGDAVELLRLIRAYYRFDKIRFRGGAVKSALARLLKDQRLGSVWIIRDGSKAVGYVILAFTFDLEFGGFEGLVTDLYIDAKYRGRGLGERALNVVDEHCRSQGIGTVELQVVEDNHDAQAFYRKIGFTRLNRIVMAREVDRRGGRGGRAGLVEEK
jgi:ribosomal protein S18 acetylase RimI-like enzyme